MLEIRLLGYCAPLDTCDPQFYSLKDKKLIEEFVNEIKNAQLEGPLKGAMWDEISMIKETDTIELKSNGNVFGVNNITFYKFKADDCYKKYFGIKSK